MQYRHLWHKISRDLRKKNEHLFGYLRRQGTRFTNGNDRFSAIAPSRHNPWLVAGASVTGHGHRPGNEPCQDAHKIRVLNNGWGVAAVSDGAGSAARSQLASALLVQKAVQQAHGLIQREQWTERKDLPSAEEWKHHAIILMKNMQEAIADLANRDATPLYELHATLIILVFSPYGLLLAHVGDGRAGCRDLSGKYHSLFSPWEGEEAGQTVFVSSAMGNIERIMGLSLFPHPVSSFFLLTDGCERVAWQTLQHNGETGLYMKKNEPFAPFFDQTLQALTHMQKTMTTDAIAQNWHQYLDSGHKGFVSETDDKTMVVGVFKPNQTIT